MRGGARGTGRCLCLQTSTSFLKPPMATLDQVLVKSPVFFCKCYKRGQANSSHQWLLIIMPLSILASFFMLQETQREEKSVCGPGLVLSTLQFLQVLTSSQYKFLQVLLQSVSVELRGEGLAGSHSAPRGRASGSRQLSVTPASLDPSLRCSEGASPHAGLASGPSPFPLAPAPTVTISFFKCSLIELICSCLGEVSVRKEEKVKGKGRGCFQPPVGSSRGKRQARARKAAPGTSLPPCLSTCSLRCPLVSASLHLGLVPHSCGTVTGWDDGGPSRSRMLCAWLAPTVCLWVRPLHAPPEAQGQSGEAVA